MKRWIDNIHSDCIEIGLETIEATRMVAVNRTEWRKTLFGLPVQPKYGFQKIIVDCLLSFFHKNEFFFK